MKKFTAAICLILAFCLLLSACGKKAGIRMGFDYKMGLLPSVFFGIESEKTEFDLDAVTLDFSYGNASFADMDAYIGGDNWETYPVICIGVYFFNAKYQDSVIAFGDGRFADYKNIEGLHFMKEITLEDYNENYRVKNKLFGCKYAHTETMTIPREVFELNRGYACIGVYEIAYVPSEDRYRIAYGSFEALKYEKLEDGKVKLSKPAGSVYADPQE